MHSFQDSAEFTKLFNGYRQSSERIGKPFVSSVSLEELPATMDWRTQGYVTEVKNQVRKPSSY